VRDTIERGEVLAQSPATAEFQLQGIQSLLKVPLVAGGTVVGFIGCDAVRAAKTWTEDHIALLRIVGEIFVTAIERRRFQQELELRAADLARSNAELEQFAYVASHDLQEPLRAVTGYTQLLARRYSGQLDAKADEYIAFAVEGAARMQQLIKDLLMYSRVGRRGNELLPVDFLAVFEAAVANLEVAVAESGATLTHGDLPTVSGDFTQLAQLLQNLLSNALKYRSDQAPVIHVSAAGENGNMRFSVRDNGIGIDQKYSDRIFQLFQRLHTRDEYPGTGIGLAICKKIVERHGGRIWVESAPGQGSTFYFTIPGEQG
jgi:light-regulated signal transduction histidine kinase (bacteriophytochrome)